MSAYFERIINEDGNTVTLKYFPDVESNEDRKKRLEGRLRYLEKEIAAYPYWGAALGAMHEEAEGLRHILRR